MPNLQENTSTSAFYHTEWANLHRSYEQAEALSLVTKLVSVALYIYTSMNTPTPLIPCILTCLLWAQDAIWKTFQSRTEARLVQLENDLVNQQATQQGFYSQWQSQRPGIVGLLKSYCLTALRPTVAFPYGPLIAITGALSLI